MRILLSAYFYPPLNSIGARRPSALAKWLRRRGHDVTVLSSVQSGRALDDHADGVVRTPDLLATRLNWRGQDLKAATGASDATWSHDPGVWGKIFVPDVQVVSWLPFLVAHALRLHRRHRFDAVISTAPLEIAHAAGLALGRLGAGWVADFRDGWRFEAPRPDWPLAAQRRLDDALERLVVRRADAVVTVSEPLSEDLRRRHGIAVETITNGFDPDDAVMVTGTAPVDPAKLTLVHTGGLGSERTIRPVLAALARLAAEDPSLRDRVEIVLAGQRTAEERELYADPAHAPFVRHLGYVERSESLALQRAADVLLLVTSGARTGEATGKLFEYLATGRPILVLGRGSAAGTIVEQAQAGIVIPTHDTDAALGALRRILAGELSALPAGGREAFGYPALAERYERTLEAAIAHRNRGGRTRSADIGRAAPR
jgi:glycosyltransferase involved in cell wall biosynthesis